MCLWSMQSPGNQMNLLSLSSQEAVCRVTTLCCPSVEGKGLSTLRFGGTEPSMTGETPTSNGRNAPEKINIKDGASASIPNICSRCKCQPKWFYFKFCCQNITDLRHCEKWQLSSRCYFPSTLFHCQHVQLSIPSTFWLSACKLDNSIPTQYSCTLSDGVISLIVSSNWSKTLHRGGRLCKHFNLLLTGED